MSTTLFAGPGTLHCAPPLRNGNGNIIFHYVVDGTVRTLTNANSGSQQSLKGLLYVPSLKDPQHAYCNDLAAPYIPANVTRLIDLPANADNIIGLAPWVSRKCTKAYLSASRQNSVQALIFYQPDSQDSAIPPPWDSPVWDLGDAGNWTKESPYPVYAVPGTAGTILMHQLEQYGGHGNGSDAKTIAECARLYALIDPEPNQSSAGPGIWVFILAILGAVVLMAIFALITLRHLQRRRRDSLQRRLVSGEIDLEYLGIKRLVVPPHILSALPIYVYPVQEGDDLDASKEEETPGDSKGEANESDVRVTETEIGESKGVIIQSSNPSTTTLVPSAEQQQEDDSIRCILEEILPPPPTRALGIRRRPISSQTLTLTFSQHTCAICLDDFVPGTSFVRELPCTHIFHPECIDTFLARDGSTCPVCKHSVLPEAFVEEQIRALLLRREERGTRRARRLRRRRYHHHGRHNAANELYLRSPVYENQHVPDSPASSPVGVMDRFRAWLARDYDEDGEERYARDRRDNEPFGSLGSILHTQRPAPAGRAATAGESEENHDPERREMMQRRAMVFLGPPASNQNVSLSS